MKKLKQNIRNMFSKNSSGPILSKRDIRNLRVESEFIDLLKHSTTIDKFSDKLYTTYKAVEYILKNKIPGDFVECGVYKGRHISMMAMSLLKFNDTERDIYLYDTFTGMTEPGVHDARSGGDDTPEKIVERWEEGQRVDHNMMRYAPLENVKRTVFQTGYPEEKFNFVKGDIRETVPNSFHNNIAILRLDTDWYELTRHELIHMYDLIPKGGLLIIDDYGSHEGAKKAIEEFFSERNMFPFLFRTTKYERVILKT